MPIYAYRCSNCGHAQDSLQKISDPVLTVCPACGQPTLVKQVTAAGFQLKGSGWYVTDFREGKSAKKGDEKGDAGKSEGGDASAKDGDKAGGSAAASTSDAAASPADKADAKSGDAKPAAAPAPAPSTAPAPAPAASSPAPPSGKPGG